jgi:CRISPR-associated endonuclease/helicase Cas3
MNALSLRILAVYSEEHPEPKYRIGDICLLKHQVATWEAIRDPEIDVIFNTAMTGDGKSLAGYLPAFQDSKRIIAMYPTNELIQDQHSGLQRYERDIERPMPANAVMFSEEITWLMRTHDISVRLEAVRQLLTKNALLLTNPDLIHLMMSYQYGWEHLRKELPATIGAYFDYFLFDEFHIFGVPQVIAVMNMLASLDVLYREKPNDRKKFVFLSATPSKLLNGLLERGGLRYRRIEGRYCSTEQPGYRCILQGCELNLHEVGQDATTEAWVEEHLEEIRSFFEQHHGSKAAILVYSVATARRLYTRLKEYFEPLGITVGENTGLTNREDRRDSYNKHILVGTTTVDIGVDFHINYLIFEAWNAGSFLQRFGRLGRHVGFGRYEAHALIPRFVLERLQLKFGATSEVERKVFNEEIREAFPTEQEFQGYTRRWGVVQAAQVLVELQGLGKRDESRAYTEALTEQFERLYCSPGKAVMAGAQKKYRALREKAPAILEELQSFRGQSPLICAVWDTDDHLKTYDLIFLLANTEYEVMEKEAFLQEVRKRGLEERDFRNALLCFRVWGYVPERMQVVLGLNTMVEEQAIHNVSVRPGFVVNEPRATWLDQVNTRLKALKLVCLISDIPRKELKGLLNLGGLFPLHILQDGTGSAYTVAFGQEALLLESLLFYRKAKDERPMIL